MKYKSIFSLFFPLNCKHPTMLLLHVIGDFWVLITIDAFEKSPEKVAEFWQLQRLLFSYFSWSFIQSCTSFSVLAFWYPLKLKLIQVIFLP